uniref:Elongation factor Ts, mitochondrial n=1 Tax=Pleurostichidium falkenbergii TaxID=121064 RepID=A0A4D6UUV4_9FLOR|nr:translation elongation factor Ts [Pleurostichidium falkenbergii]QCH39652.1 translation elongation factor Ts [Pleurostichidium falkenbergii]
MLKKNSSENIKELRNKTGAGMTDCKKALEASDGQIDIAIETLRKKGLASADKKSSRLTAEGLIQSYIHAGSRIGVLVEINCETDFVSRQPKFHQLAKDIAMQLAACQSVSYISKNDIPENIVTYEQKLELEKEDLLNKSVEIKNKIANGRVDKRIKELSLMDQNFIKQTSITIEELIKQHIALWGENIKIRRFERFLLGEGLEPKKNNFKDEVSSMIQNT